MRRLGAAIFGNSKYLERRSYPPGIHGPKSRRKKSEYAEALAEKQKLRYAYGLYEKQFRRYFQQALKQRGVTGETLLQLLETRLDNVVFRLGMAQTRPAARQSVLHGHIRVNGKKITIASYNCKAGDLIEIKGAPKSQQLVKKSLETTQVRIVPDWLSIDREHQRGQIARLPTKADIEPIAKEQMVVQFYSR
jgi:small subunit ribosomal protein S4